MARNTLLPTPAPVMSGDVNSPFHVVPLVPDPVVSYFGFSARGRGSTVSLTHSAASRRICGTACLRVNSSLSAPMFDVLSASSVPPATHPFQCTHVLATVSYFDPAQMAVSKSYLHQSKP